MFKNIRGTYRKKSINPDTQLESICWRRRDLTRWHVWLARLTASESPRIPENAWRTFTARLR
jgi:hypothetical protein